MQVLRRVERRTGHPMPGCLPLVRTLWRQANPEAAAEGLGTVTLQTMRACDLACQKEHEAAGVIKGFFIRRHMSELLTSLAHAWRWWITALRGARALPDAFLSRFCCMAGLAILSIGVGNELWQGDPSHAPIVAACNLPIPSQAVASIGTSFRGQTMPVPTKMEGLLEPDASTIAEFEMLKKQGYVVVTRSDVVPRVGVARRRRS